MTAPTPYSLAQIAAAMQAVRGQRGALGEAAADVALAALAAQQESLLAGAGPAPLLKQVSILFLDVVGSTSLARLLDPEQINHVMDGALERFTSIVQMHHGRVLQYAGDNVLAVFGGPTSQEDDAERAVLAGLAMLAEARVLGDSVHERHGYEGFGARVGIHTGPVLLGAGVDGDHSVRGIAVNVAARLEQSAPPGGLLISQDTWRAVRGRFDVQQQPPLVVKGLAEPLRSYRVLGARPGERRSVLRGVDGVVSPLVGRDGELARLQSAFELARASGLTLLTVVAEAGLGKSRLASEWRARQAGAADDEAPAAPGRWLRAQASPQGKSRPYGLLRQWLVQGLELPEREAPALARARWLQAAERLLASPADAAVLGHLIGLDFSAEPELLPLLTAPRQLRDRAFFHASQWLRARARDSTEPLVLLLDDAHWADEGTLNYIEHLAVAHPDLPALVLTLTRPSLFEQQVDWGGNFARHQRIDLQPLDARQVAELADALLSRLAPLPAAQQALLVEQAAGNPFYLEELINVLVDRGVIVADGPRRRLELQRWDRLPMPVTLVGVLQARLDALPEAARRTAQLAAVVGFRFTPSALGALGAPLPQGLSEPLAREIFVPADDSPGEYTFASHLLHQVCYDGLLKRTQRELHARAAHWLAAQLGEAPLATIAEHFERGGEPALALQHWQLAAEAAAERYANEEALAHAARALVLTPVDDLPRRHALQLLRCRVLEVQSEHGVLPPELDTLLSLAVQLGDAGRQSQALRRQARHRYDSGRITDALTLAKRAVACAPSSAPEREADARALLMQCLLRLGQHDAALAEAERALALARKAQARATEAMLLNDLGMAADEQGDHARAIGCYEEALALHRSLGNRVNEGGTLTNLAYARMMLGQHAAAAAGFDEALALFVRIGQRQNEGITLINLGLARLRLGDAVAAQGAAAAAVSLLAATRDRWAEAAAWRVLGQAVLASGQVETARTHLAQAESMFAEMQLPQLAAEARAAAVECSLVAGDEAQALADARHVALLWRHGLTLEGTEEPLRVQWLCWQALASADAALAAEVLQRARVMLLARAARIEETAARQQYLRAVPEHRALLSA